MAIQWFPGHMNSARRKATETMAKIDVVIEVVDARLPEASCNPMILPMRTHRNRPCLKVLNKSDLADPAITAEWLAHYNAQPGLRAIAISSKKLGEVKRIVAECRKLAPHRSDAHKPLRMMIMGIPNVGKSTIMNALLGRKVAAVGDEPAVTKSQQALAIDSTATLTDTPGLMWPKIAHDSDGFMLAASHAIGVNAVLEEDVAAYLADQLLADYPPLIAQRYGFDTSEMDGADVVDAIAELRNCKRKTRGGALSVDREKASIILLTDYRAGILGRISLESPASRARMVAKSGLDDSALDTALDDA
jgi:ribosome biogenesis GTPase A